MGLKFSYKMKEIRFSQANDNWGTVSLIDLILQEILCSLDKSRVLNIRNMDYSKKKSNREE